MLINLQPGGAPHLAFEMWDDTFRAFLGSANEYDAEGRICAVQSTPVSAYATMTGYLYNAKGERVAKGTITTMSCDPASRE